MMRECKCHVSYTYSFENSAAHARESDKATLKYEADEDRHSLVFLCLAQFEIVSFTSNIYSSLHIHVTDIEIKPLDDVRK